MPTEAHTSLLSYGHIADGTTVTGDERATLVFAKEVGVWKIAHEHFSPVVLGG